MAKMDEDHRHRERRLAAVVTECCSDSCCEISPVLAAPPARLLQSYITRRHDCRSRLYSIFMCLQSCITRRHDCRSRLYSTFMCLQSYITRRHDCRSRLYSTFMCLQSYITHRHDCRSRLYSTFMCLQSYITLVNEYYQLQLGRQRQVWLIRLRIEHVGVQVKL